MRTPIALTASAILAVIGFGLQPAAQAAPEGHARACYYTSQATSYHAYDDHTIYVGGAGRRIFRITTDNACNPERGDGHFLIQPVSGSICGPLDMQLSVVSHGFRQPCMIREIVELTPEEIADLPSRARP
jgi:hypothetical protein